MSVMIDERNLSVAWGKVFKQVFSVRDGTPIVVTLNDLNGRPPPEDTDIRGALDSLLRDQGNKPDCHTTANTIFPSSMWDRRARRDELYRRYLNVLPRLRQDGRNRNGLYFERLIAFGRDGPDEDGTNQLEHILQTWKRGNRRKTALQAALFDPKKDHTHQRQRGFPCLQHVILTPQPDNGLALTGVYATQYIVERAYGNYMGLWRLGDFMAHEMDLTLRQVTCIAVPAKLGAIPKYRLSQLKGVVEDALSGVGHAS